MAVMRHSSLRPSSCGRSSRPVTAGWPACSARTRRLSRSRAAERPAASRCPSRQRSAVPQGQPTGTMDPAVDVSEDELISWMVRDSAVPASLDPEPGDSERPFGLEIEFVFEEILLEEDKAERIQRIIDDLRRFGLTEQTEIGEDLSAGVQTRPSGAG